MIEFANIIYNKSVQKFLLKFYLSEIFIKNLILISPYISKLEGTNVTFEALLNKTLEKNITVYLITRTPCYEEQQNAIDILMKYNHVEIRFNEALHAKLYLCLCQEEVNNFAMLGSGNLTRSSIERNIEIAMLINGYGKGKDTIRELSHWSLNILRTLNSTKIIKKISRRN